MTTVLSSKGQIVIPAEIRARHKFMPGDVLEITDRREQIVLQKVPRKPRKTLAQLLLECPGKLELERIADVPRDIPL